MGGGTRPYANDEKVIIIDTEDYSGNFEREMCAYITGQIGECGVGSEAAEVAKQELSQELLDWFDNHICQYTDEIGCTRPTAIAVTPGWYNNGHGKHIREGARYRGKLYQGQKWPAYQSVDIVFDEWPDDDTMTLIVDRAKKFCADYYPNQSLFSEPGKTKPIPFSRVRTETRKTVVEQVKEYK